jgi:tetratricopeptide (TPR) repeat protein
MDYRSVLEVAPDDPAAWNNLGNATAGLGDWKGAAEFYGRAVALTPQFAFAAGNLSLANYQLGNNDGAAMRDMRALLRKYPEFDDVRAALAAALWEAGLLSQAEDEWRRVEDPRYRDLDWLKRNRRWPPRLFTALRAFLNVRPVEASASGG